MSADKLSESDSLPDQGADVTDKPFPGASADREPTSAPEPSPSMDQMRAAYANAGSASDIEASAKADEAAAATGSDTGTAMPEVSAQGVSEPGVSESSAEGTAAGVQDGAVVAGTVVPDGDAEGPSAHSDGSALAGEVRQPEGTAGPERTDIPAFPGAPPDREPAPAPEPAPSMDQMREAFARSSNSEELQAAAKADEAAAKEAPAEKGTAAAKPGGDAATGRDAVASGEPVAGESGEQQQGEEDGSGAAEETTPEQPVVLRAPQQEMPAAEAPEGEPAPLDGGRADTAMVNQPDARHEDVVVLDPGEDTEAAEPTAEGIEPANEGVVATRSDVLAPEADDKPVVAGVVEPERPEAGVPPEEGDAGDTNASRSEVRLDTQSDDQRPVTHAEMMAMIAEMKAEAKAEAKAEMAAEYDAKFESMDAKRETERAELTQKVSELEAKLELLQGSSDADADGDADQEDAASSDGNGQPPDDGMPLEGSDNPNFTWTTLPPEGRTVGDTTPTGIGLKPEGEQLRETDAKTSRLDALRKTAYESETIENVHDAVEEYADPLQKLFERPPTSTHADVPVDHPVYIPADHEHAAANDMVMAAFVVGLVGVEGARATRHAVHNLRDKTHDWMGRHQHAGD